MERKRGKKERERRRDFAETELSIENVGKGKTIIIGDVSVERKMPMVTLVQKLSDVYRNHQPIYLQRKLILIY